MPFIITCTNRGCGETQAPFLERGTDKVFCSKCEREIENITSFAKNQMKMSKQFKEKEKKSFSVKCDLCKVEARPYLDNDKVMCSHCKKELKQLSQPFVMMLKVQLKKLGKEGD